MNMSMYVPNVPQRVLTCSLFSRMERQRRGTRSGGWSQKSVKSETPRVTSVTILVWMLRPRLFALYPGIIWAYFLTTKKLCDCPRDLVKDPNLDCIMGPIPTYPSLTHNKLANKQPPCLLMLAINGGATRPWKYRPLCTINTPCKRLS